jgi:hypothetical protein
VIMTLSSVLAAPGGVRAHPTSRLSARRTLPSDGTQVGGRPVGCLRVPATLLPPRFLRRGHARRLATVTAAAVARSKTSGDVEALDNILAQVRVAMVGPGLAHVARTTSYAYDAVAG